MVNGLTVLGGADVVLAGDATDPPGRGVAVARLAGDTGATVWQTHIGAPSPRWQAALQVAVDGDDVYVAGVVDDGSGQGTEGGQILTVVRLDGATGAIRWTWSQGGASRRGRPYAIAFGPADTVLVGGITSPGASCGDATVVALDRATGGPVWKRSRDGSFVASSCVRTCFDVGPCSTVDDDAVTALGVLPDETIAFASVLLDGASGAARRVTTLTRLRPRIR
jgi:hypothetical protein